jgi:hypothetical protein
MSYVINDAENGENHFSIQLEMYILEFSDTKLSFVTSHKEQVLSLIEDANSTAKHKNIQILTDPTQRLWPKSPASRWRLYASIETQ